MASYNHIIISLTSGSDIAFKAVQYKPIFKRRGSVEETLSGALDHTIGPVIEGFSYIIRVPIDPITDEYPTSGSYGNYDDLVDIVKLYEPAVSPKPMFTLTDHRGEIHRGCSLTPDVVSVDPLTTQLEGPNAYMLVPIQIIKTPVVFVDNTDFSDPDVSFNLVIFG